VTDSLTLRQHLLLAVRSYWATEGRPPMVAEIAGMLLRNGVYSDAKQVYRDISRHRRAGFLWPPVGHGGPKWDGYGLRVTPLGRELIDP